MIGGEAVTAGTVIWAAGVAASPATRWLGVETDGAGRVVVASDLSIPGQPNLFVIGDAALVKTPGGTVVPGIAPAAKQEGHYVARMIRERLRSSPPASASVQTAFRYRHADNLATIGRRAAVIEFPKLRLRGRLAWWVWGISHIYFLVGVRSPLLVTLNWLWQYLTYAQGARLITGDEQAR